MSPRLAWLAALGLSAGLASPAVAQFTGIDKMFREEPRDAPTAPPASAPRPGTPAPATPAPDTTPAAPPGAPTAAAEFPALAGCATSLAGLPVLPHADLVAHLERRVGLWRSASFTDVPPFEVREQAKFALACFERRLALLAAYLPENAPDAELRAQLNELNSKWAGRLGPFLSGAGPMDGDVESWWRDADAALGLLVTVELGLVDSANDGSAARHAQLEPPRLALAEFARTVADVDRNEDVIKPDEREFWLRALAWRARSAGLAMDLVQLDDLAREPELAYNHLAAPEDSEPGLSVVPPNVAAALATARAIRDNRSILDPGAPRDWGTPAEFARIAEELYLVNVIAQTIERRIHNHQATEAESRRAQLQVAYERAVANGSPEAESRARRNAAWKSFRAEQQELRAGALLRWQADTIARRHQLIQSAVTIVQQRKANPRPNSRQ